MSKQTDDLIDRVEGAVTALRGIKVRLSPPPPTYVMPADMPPPPPQKATQEDYAFAKKVVEELKGVVAALEAEVAKESHVPEPNATGEAGDHKTKAKA